MICKLCGKENEDASVFCANCGAQLEAQNAAEPTPVVEPQLQPQPQQVPPQWAYPQTPAIPESHKPLSPWAYLGYQFLFAIPLVGFILLIVFSLNNSGNINLRNFARSYWCAALVGVIFVVIAVVLGIALGGSVAAIIRNGMY